MLVSDMSVSVSMSASPRWCQCLGLEPLIKAFGIPAPKDKCRGTRQLFDLTGILLFLLEEDGVILLV